MNRQGQQLAINRYYTQNPRFPWSMSEIAFHEKAGRSQVVLLFFRRTRFFSGRVSRCRHPSIRTLVSDLGSLGASWAFSFQPVLPPDYRPALPSFRWRLGQAIDAVTGTRLWALAFPFFEWFGFMPPPASISVCSCATVRTPLRSPTSDAATPRAFSPWR